MKNGFLKLILKKLKLNESTVSVILGGMVLVIIGALIVNYFRNIGKNETGPESLIAPEEYNGVKLIEENGEMVPEALPTLHLVQKGESLWEIAEKYFGSGYNWVDIAEENSLANPNMIEAEQQLAIPKAAVIKPETTQDLTFGPPISGDAYQVQKGDHLWGIAVRAYGDGYRWTEISLANDLEDPNTIHAGNTLTIPR